MTTPIWLRRKSARYTDTGPKLCTTVVDNAKALLPIDRGYYFDDNACKCGYHVCIKTGACEPEPALPELTLSAEGARGILDMIESPPVPSRFLRMCLTMTPHHQETLSDMRTEWVHVRGTLVAKDKP